MTSRAADLSNPSNSVNSYICEICRDIYYHPTLVYSCDNGHYFCKTCYSPSLYEGNDPVCPYENCKSQVCRLDKRSLRIKSSGRGNIPIKSMFPTPEKITRQASTELLLKSSYSSFYRGENSSVSASRRPIRCPFPGCKRTIAVSGFDSHFKYEHTSVAYINTYFERRNNVTFNPYDLQYNRNHCIVMINLLDDVRNGVSNYSLKASSSEASFIKPVMLVMASKIPCVHLNDSDPESGDDEFAEHFDSCAPTDKVLIWVVSNVATKYRYTLALSTPCKTIRLKYCGVVCQVHEDRAMLCEHGRGLILSSFHTTGMTNHGKKALTLDIIFLHADKRTSGIVSN